MQESIFAMMEKSCCVLNLANLLSRKFLLKFLSKFAGAVMDNDTGKLMEYNNLMKNLKY